MDQPEHIRVLIADDFKLLRDVIRLQLSESSDIKVVDEVPDLDGALERTATYRPDVIIMNDYLPPIDSAHAAALFRERGITAAILVISMQPDIDQIENAFRNGVNGFMDKDEIVPYLAEAVHNVHRGERYLSPHAREIRGTDEE